jgi:nucleotide-binding universal stress UspA family protein
MKIVVGTDFNDLATAALRVAAELATELVVVYANPFDPPVEFTAAQLDDLARQTERSRKRAAEELERYVARHVKKSIPWRALVVDSSPATAIAAVAKAENADLIAIGTHGHGSIPRLVFGSVAKSLMRASDVPLMVVRSKDGREYEVFRNGRKVELSHVV